MHGIRVVQRPEPCLVKLVDVVAVPVDARLISIQNQESDSGEGKGAYHQPRFGPSFTQVEMMFAVLSQHCCHSTSMEGYPRYMNASTLEETPMAISQFVLSVFCVVTVVSLRTSAGTSQELLQITWVVVSTAKEDAWE